jgi:hypothetical protein
MEKLEFKSQICTTREQSEKLLKFGLKKETADMVWMKELAWDEVAHCTYDAETYMLRPIDYLEGESHREHIPAWSFSRLLELLYNGASASIRNLMKLGCNEINYDTIIDCIGDLVKLNHFNKDYLEEKK